MNGVSAISTVTRKLRKGTVYLFYFLTHSEYDKDLERPAMKTTQLSKFENIPADYARLLTMFMPKAIHDEVDYENTVEVIDIMAGHDLNDDQELYLDTLSTLVEAYEESHHEVKSRRLTPLDALEFPDGRTRDERG